MEQVTLEYLAKRAYDAYARKRDWMAFNGQPIPQYDDVPEGVKDGWREAVSEVVQLLNQPIFENLQAEIIAKHQASQ